MAVIFQELGAVLPELSKAVFSQPVDKLSDQKVTVRPVQLKGQRMFQVESFRDNKAFHRNIDGYGLVDYAQKHLEGRYRQVLLATEKESCQYVLKQNGSYKKSGKAAAVPRPKGVESHNREKEYILKEGENIPALVDLGVFTKDMRIVRSKYDKYKQINRFIELVDQELRQYDSQEISILDFGCGKSYLTFILYYYFAVKRGMRAKIIGYDLKSDVVQRCNEIAQSYGYEGLRFQVADVTKDSLAQEHIDMVVTLHACDIATDFALDYAIKRKVKHIFSVPCCQHEVNSSIKKGGELDLLMEHGVIKERMCALLTDAIRGAVLESKGYELEMIEFIDLDNSPKNLMIRARYTGKCRAKGLEKALLLQEKYGFQQKLLELEGN